MGFCTSHACQEKARKSTRELKDVREELKDTQEELQRTKERVIELEKTEAALMQTRETLRRFEDRTVELAEEVNTAPAQTGLTGARGLYRISTARDTELDDNFCERLRGRNSLPGRPPITRLWVRKLTGALGPMELLVEKSREQNHAVLTTS
jgi:hypothetical protein